MNTSSHAFSLFNWLLLLRAHTHISMLYSVCVSSVQHYAKSKVQMYSPYVHLLSSWTSSLSDPWEPQSSCWRAAKDPNQGRAKAGRFQATDHTSRHHGHTHCETSGERRSETRAMITDNVENYSVCCLFFKCIYFFFPASSFTWHCVRNRRECSRYHRSYRRTRNTWPGWHNGSWTRQTFKENDTGGSPWGLFTAVEPALSNKAIEQKIDM